MKVNLPYGNAKGEQPSTYPTGTPKANNLQPSTYPTGTPRANNPPSTDPRGTPRANSPQPNLIIMACTS
ncbi:MULTISPECIES: hypothetical protein [unclassified Moorena]|uniref:hypothetical protein n=1 Tax=unclassified Moorena TaxID=2683338 RepID=UPI0013C84956|nr:MULTISPECIES: hypothetical protein [unclassified Moorena]NEO20815.1 hypothetical protein [Moorena sp. SIO4A5]NEP29325.1 hypothetical protein [Moorena sp. SIO3I6]NEQ61216.1 hypothetical protein [Moorena sp. SIO4A1]